MGIKNYRIFLIINIMIKLHKEEGIKIIKNNENEDDLIPRINYNHIKKKYEEICSLYSITKEKNRPEIDYIIDNFLWKRPGIFNTEIKNSTIVYSTIPFWDKFKEYYHKHEDLYINTLRHCALQPATDIWNKSQERYGPIKQLPENSKVYTNGLGNIAVVSDEGVLIRQAGPKSNNLYQSKFYIELDASEINYIISNPDKPKKLKFKN